MISNLSRMLYLLPLGNMQEFFPAREQRLQGNDEIELDSRTPGNDICICFVIPDRAYDFTRDLSSCVVSMRVGIQ